MSGNDGRVCADAGSSAGRRRPDERRTGAAVACVGMRSAGRRARALMTSSGAAGPGRGASGVVSRMGGRWRVWRAAKTGQEGRVVTPGASHVGGNAGVRRSRLLSSLASVVVRTDGSTMGYVR